MALNDPLSLTIAAATSPLPRIIDDGLKSVYISADGKITETVSHQVTSQKRRTLVRIDLSKVAADPFTAVNKVIPASVQFVFEFPTWGYTEQEKIDAYVGLNAQLTAATNAILKRVLAGEH